LLLAFFSSLADQGDTFSELQGLSEYRIADIALNAIQYNSAGRNNSHKDYHYRYTVWKEDAEIHGNYDLESIIHYPSYSKQCVIDPDHPAIIPLRSEEKAKTREQQEIEHLREKCEMEIEESNSKLKMG